MSTSAMMMHWAKMPAWMNELMKLPLAGAAVGIVRLLQRVEPVLRQLGLVGAGVLLEHPLELAAGGRLAVRWPR